MHILNIITVLVLIPLLWALLIIKKKKAALKSLVIVCAFSLLALQSVFILKGLLIFKKYSAIYSILLELFIYSALLEEAVKALFFCISIFILKSAVLKFSILHICNLISLSVFYGLVFAAVESVIYELNYSNSIYLRIFTAFLLHGGIGYFYVKMSIETKKASLIYYFLSAWVLHSLYNMFFLIGGVFIIFALIIIVFLTIKNYELLL